MSKFKNISSWGKADSQSTAPGTLDSKAVKSLEGNLSRIRRGRKQYRTHTDEAHIQQLMSSIREHGFTGTIPVLRVEDEDYDFEYLGGHTTGEALRRLGYETVPLSIETVEDSLSLAEFSYQLNGANRPLNALDDTLAILDILAEALALKLGEVDKDEIPTLIRQIARETEKVDSAKINCIKETWERNEFEISIKSFAASRLPLLNLNEKLKEGVQQGLSPASALEINKVENPSARGELIDKAMNMSVTAVKQAVREELKAERPPSKPPVWEPVAKFRSFAARVNKLNPNSISPGKQKKLERALASVQKVLDEIENS
ncbi:MAG: ParB N-terminal domain-containing protein [Leptolyngbya sp. SIOISBB]|nr:ParB N-terminal domain-containing protein [Leptolyngbya sp. SIOISBB]